MKLLSFWKKAGLLPSLPETVYGIAANVLNASALERLKK